MPTADCIHFHLFLTVSADIFPTLELKLSAELTHEIYLYFLSCQTPGSTSADVFIFDKANANRSKHFYAQ